MPKPNDGGPAFPQNDATVNRINNQDGMSLRDYFAGQALVGILAGGFRNEAINRDCPYVISDGTVETVWDDDFLPASISKLTYSAADAMIAERDKPDNSVSNAMETP